MPPQTIIDPCVIHMDLRATDSFLEETQKGRQLSPLDGALNLKLTVHRPHLLVEVQQHHWSSTSAPSSCHSQQRTISADVMKKSSAGMLQLFVLVRLPFSRH